MHYYGTRLSENLSRRESASSIYATPHCGDRLFRLTSLGCRPFSSEKEPLALSPGVPNPLTGFQPLAALRGSPGRLPAQ